MGKTVRILKKGIKLSGAISRSLIGLGASAVLFLAVTKRKKKAN